MWSPPKMQTMSGRVSRTRFRFWKIASAVPEYQTSPVCIWAGTGMMKLPGRRLVPAQARCRCSVSDWLLNCVST